MKPELKEYYYENGTIKQQIWFLNDKLHNENGPAIIWYYRDGQIIDKVWYLNDIEYTEDEHKIRIFCDIK